jgi:class 3 adenylate cyclase
MISKGFPKNGIIKLTYLLLLCMFFPILVGAQEVISKQGSDPLQGRQPVDSTEIITLLEEAETLRFTNQTDSAIVAAQKAIRLSDDAGYEVGKAEGFKTIGGTYYDMGNFEEALAYFNRSLQVYIKEADTTGIGNLQSNLGSVYADLGDNPRALEYYIKSLRNAQYMSDTMGIGRAHMNLGTVYQEDQSTHEQAIENYQLAIDLFREIDFGFGVAGTQLNIGDWYIKQKNPQKAVPYLEDALAGFKKVGYYPAYPLNSLGKAYFDLDQYDKARQYYQEALIEAANNPNPSQETSTQLGLGSINLELKNYLQAIENLKLALELAKQTRVLADQEEIYQKLSQAYDSVNDLANAYEMQKQYSLVRDSLKAEDYAKEMSALRVVFDLENAERQNDLLRARNEINELQIEEDARQRQLLLIILGLFLAIIAGFVFQFFYIRRTNKRLAFERNRSEQILLNILPKETADELKENGFVKAREFDQITVLFTDFKAFSLVAERISAERLVKSVDYYFKSFDEITERHNLEKIKTIGDAYMCAGGLPSRNDTHVRDAFGAAREILKFVNDTELDPPPGIYPFKIRIGLNSGPVVAGVVGTKKFAYDIWGNTVNIAARMESGSVPGRINVSESIYEELKEEHDFTFRGELKVKNQVFKMYFADVPETIFD